MPPAVGMPAGLTVVFGGTKGGVPVPVVLVPANLLTSAAVPAPIAAFFSVLVNVLVGFVTGFVIGVPVGFTGFVGVVNFVGVVLAATGVFVVLAGAFVVVLAATGVLVVAGLRAVVVLVAAGFAVTGFAAGALIVEVTGGLGLACGALLVCTRETGAPEVVPRGVATPSDTGARLEIVSRGARVTDVKSRRPPRSPRPPRSGREKPSPKSNSVGLNF
jgi:hypothetical protein